MLKWFNQITMAMANKCIKCKEYFYCLLFCFISQACSSATENNTDKTIPKTTEKAYEVYTVEIKDMKFIPDSITVKKGDEVVFVNRDMVTHCVTEEKTKAWTSSAIPTGESYLLVANESSQYYCAIHTVMKGKIIVK